MTTSITAQRHVLVWSQRPWIHVVAVMALRPGQLVVPVGLRLHWGAWEEQTQSTGSPDQQRVDSVAAGCETTGLFSMQSELIPNH